VEYHYLASDFDSTCVHIEATVCSARFTQLAFECVHSWLEVWNT